jgi:hypothetical protein
MNKYKALHRSLDAADALIFFDLEATQISHKAIAIGLVIQPKKRGGLIDYTQGPITYHSYIKTKHNIGPVVERLTGITKQTLKKEGKEFHQVILEITNLLRPYHNKRFISYGNGDMHILSQTIDYADETERNFFQHLKKNYFDLSNYLSKRIVSSEGNMLSLSKLGEEYEISLDGKPHSPLYDSQMLAQIFNCYIKEEEKTLALVLQNYGVNKNMAQISHQFTKRLLERGTADKKDLISLLEDFL